MRSRRNSKFPANDISKDNILGSSRKPSPPKIYMNSSNVNQMPLDSSFQRKGRSTPKDCLGLVNPYQQKLLLPNRDTSRMSNKSGRITAKISRFQQIFIQFFQLKMVFHVYFFKKASLLEQSQIHSVFLIIYPQLFIFQLLSVI